MQTEVGSNPNTYTLTWNGTAKERNYEVHESVETLTVLAPGTLYYCESGADGVWTKGGKDALRFVYKRTWDDETAFDRFPTRDAGEASAAPDRGAAPRAWTRVPRTTRPAAHMIPGTLPKDAAARAPPRQ